MDLTPGERLILLMLCDIHQATVRDRGEMNP